jgi:hypothetical protein
MPLPPSRELVLKKLHECFPDPVVATEAIESLDRYGDREWHIAKDLVHLAILKLSEGALSRLRDYVQVARKDFRDVLFEAQEPERFRRLVKVWPAVMRNLRSKPLSAAKEAAMRKRDQAQWERWVKSDGT